MVRRHAEKGSDLGARLVGLAARRFRASGVTGNRAIAEAFGVELGPIIGTNLFQQFLTTIDPREHRLLLSRRRDASARDEHLRRLAAQVVDAPFIMWSDHYMIARGRVGSHTGLNLFVDTGLVAVTAEKGQAALLASQTTLDGWGVSRSSAEALADLPGTLALGPICRERMTAISVPDKIWRDFGTWGGIQVDALISWGFLKHATWTIDFDRYVYCFSEDIKDWQHP